MRTYSASITIHLTPFKAANNSQADSIVNSYVDILANAQAEELRINGEQITWPEVDWHYTHVGGEQ
jgi:hypothetical protein